MLLVAAVLMPPRSTPGTCKYPKQGSEDEEPEKHGILTILGPDILVTAVYMGARASHPRGSRARDEGQDTPLTLMPLIPQS